MRKSSDKKYANDVNVSALELIPADALNVLDVGCGTGTNAAYLKDQGKHIDGITLSEDEAAECRKTMDSVWVHNLEGGLPAETCEGRKYDAVLCSHVLEHIAYPEKLLSDIRSVLNENGALVVALPNVMHYRSRWQLFRGNFPFRDSGIWDYTHLRWYTFKSAQEMLSRNGFEVTSTRWHVLLPFGRITRHLPGGLRKGLEGFLAFLSKGLFSGQMLFQVKVK